MGQKERDLINERLLSLPENTRLFRINCGMAWAGKIVKRTPGMLILQNPRPFYGAPNGWSDLAGWETITITPEMVGQKIAVFLFEEVKATGNLSTDQKKFQSVLEKMGGIFRVIKPR